MARTARILLPGVLSLVLLAALPAAGQTGEEQEVAAVPASSVALAQFTTAVENHEPIDAVAFLSTDHTQILFFTDLRGLTGETVTHRWEFDGKVMAEVPFQVGGDRWRVWSSKQLQAIWLGQWTVSVVKGDGEVIASESFSYQKKE